MEKKKVAVIGGGAAGIMVAASLVESEAQCDVVIFERNKKLGTKVVISGGGRCNLTTGITDRKELLSKYVRGGRFLKTAIAKFSPQRVIEWFESYGVKVKTENDLRVFPVSDDGNEVVAVFEKMFRENSVELHMGESVDVVEPYGDGKFKIISDKDEYEFDFVVLTTGGEAFSHTGSNGDGYVFARNFGHSITRLGPALNSFLSNEKWPRSLSGVSLKNVSLSAEVEGKGRVSVFGAMLFTHFGISGPVVFALSSHLAFTKISVHYPLKIFISPICEWGYDKWNKLLIDYFQKNGTQRILTFLKVYFPTRFARVLLNEAGISDEKKNSEISKNERLSLVKLLVGGLFVTTVQRRSGDEFVTAGGVSLDEVNFKTMESKLYSGLYFAGEVLNVDAVTGGFNLQSAWATGRLAGKSIAAAL